jgi:glycyl-tRNA synthetase (class II)
MTQNTVTVRERDAMSQERISMDQLEKYFNDKIYNVK